MIFQCPIWNIKPRPPLISNPIFEYVRCASFEKDTSQKRMQLMKKGKMFAGPRGDLGRVERDSYLEGAKSIGLMTFGKSNSQQITAWSIAKFQHLKWFQLSQVISLTKFCKSMFQHITAYNNQLHISNQYSKSAPSVNLSPEPGAPRGSRTPPQWG